MSSKHRFITMTVTEPSLPFRYLADAEDIPTEVECASIHIDLKMGHVTLPGGFKTTIEDLSRVVTQAQRAHREYNFAHRDLAASFNKHLRQSR